MVVRQKNNVVFGGNVDFGIGVAEPGHQGVDQLLHQRPRCGQSCRSLWEGSIELIFCWKLHDGRQTKKNNVVLGEWRFLKNWNRMHVTLIISNFESWKSDDARVIFKRFSLWWNMKGKATLFVSIRVVVWGTTDASIVRTLCCSAGHWPSDSRHRKI